MTDAWTELEKDAQSAAESGSLIYYSSPQTILTLIAQVRKAREAGLEEAAGVCDDHAHALERNREPIETQWAVTGCAKAIRALARTGEAP